MSKPLDLYPLATSGGQYIPFEVARPVGCIVKTVGLIGSAVLSLPAGSEDDILKLRSNVDTYILFDNAVAVIPADGIYVAYLTYIPKDTDVHLMVENLTYSVISLVAGTLTISILETWRGLSMPSQFTRR